MRRVAVMSLLVLVLATGVGAAAEDEPPPGAMLIVLDASGSMGNLDEDGVPFIDKAKAAVAGLVDALPDDMQIGLRVYGHREPNTDRTRGCQDTELMVPVGPLDRSAISDALADVDASGFTPIGLSLQEAVEDLPETGARSIVLISDGEDTCAPPDPCQVAEELFGDQLDVRIESVGFLVGTGSAAEQQLRCIADATGGGYTAVEDANALVARLNEVSETISEWRPPLILNGALDQLSAQEIPLSPKADWVTDEPGKIATTRFDGIIMPGETRWYSFDLWVREAVWVWTDLEWPPGLEAEGHLETLILDEDGNRVEAEVGHGEHPLRTELPKSESPMVGAAVQETGEGWPEHGSYLVGLHWDAPSEVFLGALHVSVEVLSEPARYLRRAEVVGATDPELAPALPLSGLDENGPDWRGGEFRGPLAAGETRWYRLDLDRGEVVNAWALFPGDRYVGAGTEGEFSMVLTDGDGNSVGQPFEAESLSQQFGSGQHQATVGATTVTDSGRLPETVLVGFSWTGQGGEESEIRFEVEAIFDEQRSDAGERIDEEAGPAEAAETTSAPESEAVETESAEDASSTGSDSPVLPAIALAIVVGGLGALVARRVRSRR